MEFDFLTVIQLIVAAGGLGGIFRIVWILSHMETLMGGVISQGNDHEIRLREVEKRERKYA